MHWKRSRMARALVSAAVLACVGATITWTHSAFTATTANAGNTLAAGTVSLSDDDSGTAMLSLAAAKPGDTDTACIQVSYTGSLPAWVKLYGTTTGSGLDAYLNVTVTRGTLSPASFDSCAGFSADATDYNGLGNGVVYSGTLSAYPKTWAAGQADPKLSGLETWTTGEAHAYRFALTVNDTNSAQGLDATEAFTWEARSMSYAEQVLTDAPTSFYRLGEASGTTMADTGGSDPGTYMGTPVLGQTGAYYDDDGGVRENSSDDYATVPDSTRNSYATAMSMDGWYKFDYLPQAGDALSYMGLIYKAGSYILRVQLTSGTDRLVMYDYNTNNCGTPGQVTGATALQTGVWYHLAGTWDGSTQKVYVNGQLDNSAARTSNLCDTANAVQLGQTGTHFQGTMSDVALYPTALSGARVSAHYAAGR